jgi:hypothetical protein
MVRLCVVHLVVLQILGVLNLDEIPPFLDVALRFLVDVEVGEELRHLLKMDCCLGEVGEELRHLLKMDCCQDEAQVELALWHFQPRAQPLHSLQPLLC